MTINLIIYFYNRGAARFCDFGVRSYIKVDFWLKSTFGCTSPILEKIGENGRSLANRPKSARIYICGLGVKSRIYTII